MAIEDAVVYALFELPTLLISKALRRIFPLTERQAETMATVVVLGLVVGLCFLAWWMYLHR